MKISDFQPAHRTLPAFLLTLLLTMAPAWALPNPWSGLRLRNIGPAIAGGRVSTVVGIPHDPLVYYVGAAGGGVWKTTDGGNTWKEILNHADTSSIGDIALAPSNPNLVWVGTGEANPRNDMITGGGVYFSSDAGASWRFMGFRHAGQIPRIVVDPANSKVVFVCALGNVWKPGGPRGLYRSTNGGRSWQQVLSVNAQTGCDDVAFEPGNPEVLLASTWQVRRFPWKLDDGGPGSGLWRSEDGGRTWHPLHDGLPPKPYGRIAFAFAPSRPQRVYALIEAKKGLLWRSDDLGTRWHFVSDNYNIDVRPFYFTQLAVSPTDADRIFFLSMKMMESTNGGKTAFYADPMIHVDHHAIWIDPANANRIIQGNDGGVALSLNGGRNWRYLNNLPIEEFYSVAVSPGYPFWICGGIQDNNAWCGPSSEYNRGSVTGSDWFIVAGGDGQYAVPAWSDSRRIYADSQNGFIARYNRVSGQSHFIIPTYSGFAGNRPLAQEKYRFNWTAPIAVSYRDPNEVYLGANVLFRSRDGGLHWKVISPDLTRNDKAKEGLTGGPVNYDLSGAENYDTIQSISIARTNPQVLWVGTDDGLVWVTRNGGRNWQKVTPPDAPAWARVYQIGVSPFNAGSAYLSFDAHELGNNRPYVYHTDNYGHSWHPIDRGLPDDSSVLVVREDPNDRGFLVAGTMTGVYYSHDRGGRWHRLTANLPTMPVWDLKFVHHPDSLVLASHGRGLWVLDNLKPLEGLTRAIAQKPFALFPTQPGMTLRAHYSGHPPAPYYSAPNAPQGVVISYFVGKVKHPARRVRITVESPTGQRLIVLHGPASFGVHELVWNMRYRGPRPLKIGPPAPAGFMNRSFGPLAVPGTYRVIAQAGATHAEVPAQILQNPHHPIALAIWREDLALGLTARNELSAFNHMLNRLQVVKVALSRISGNPGTKSLPASFVTQGRQLRARISRFENRLYNPRIQRNAAEDSLHFLARFHREINLSYSVASFFLQGRAPNHRMLALLGKKRSELKQILERYDTGILPAIAAYNARAWKLGQPTLLKGRAIRLRKPVTL
jgi:hypothetical protein